jgi:hypothetical protein
MAILAVSKLRLISASLSSGSAARTLPAFGLEALAAGHTRVALIAGRQDVETGAERREGFELAVRAAGLEPRIADGGFRDQRMISALRCQCSFGSLASSRSTSRPADPTSRVKWSQVNSPAAPASVSARRSPPERM